MKSCNIIELYLDIFDHVELLGLFGNSPHKSGSSITSLASRVQDEKNDQAGNQIYIKIESLKNEVEPCPFFIPEGYIFAFEYFFHDDIKIEYIAKVFFLVDFSLYLLDSPSFAGKEFFFHEYYFSEGAGLQQVDELIGGEFLHSALHVVSEEQCEEKDSDNSVDIKLLVVDGLSMNIYFLDEILQPLIEIIGLFIFIVVVGVLAIVLRKEENIPPKGSYEPPLEEKGRWEVFGYGPGYEHIYYN